MDQILLHCIYLFWKIRGVLRDITLNIRFITYEKFSLLGPVKFVHIDGICFHCLQIILGIISGEGEKNLLKDMSSMEHSRPLSLWSLASIGNVFFTCL